MNRLFGTSKPQQPKPTLNDAISTSDSRADSISLKIHKLDAEIAIYKNQLSKLSEGASKNSVKQRAMRLLKQRNLLLNQRDQLQQQSFNLEQAAFTTENLKSTMLTVDVMKSTAKDMKKQYKHINIDKIEDLQDEMEDLMFQANEVQETMARSYGVSDDITDADLEAELACLDDDLKFEMADYIIDLDKNTVPNTEPMTLPGSLMKVDDVKKEQVLKL